MEEVVFEVLEGQDIAGLEKKANRLPGVDRSLVDMDKQEIVVQYDERTITPDQIKAELMT
jgi:copper chaperone CopZ